MKSGIAILFILIGLLLMVFSRTLANYEEREYSEKPEWYKRFFALYKSAKYLHWVYKFVGAFFVLGGITDLLGH